MSKLLLISTSYPDTNEGSAAAGVFVRNFAEECVRQGIETEIVAPSSRDAMQDENGVRVRRFAIPKQPLSLLSPARPADWPAILQTLRHGSRTVMRACAEHTPEHILALWALPSGAWARSAARRFSITYSTWALGSDIWSLARVPVVRTILRQVLADATYRFADGYQLAADVQALSGKNCDFMPSSRQLRLTDKTLRTQPPYRVTFLGRWHPNKGIDLLLDALELLDEPAWHHIECVRIFGGGPLEQEVRSRAERLARLDRPVQVGGYLDQEQATHLLQDTDYLLLPSRIESIPVVFSDALQTACPIIAMPVGDLPLLFERYRYGELASQVTAEAFASALQRALQGSPADFAPEIGKARSVFDVAQAVSRLQQRIGSRQHPLTAS